MFIIKTINLLNSYPFLKRNYFNLNKCTEKTNLLVKRCPSNSTHIALNWFFNDDEKSIAYIDIAETFCSRINVMPTNKNMILYFETLSQHECSKSILFLNKWLQIGPFIFLSNCNIFNLNLQLRSSKWITKTLCSSCVSNFQTNQYVKPHNFAFVSFYSNVGQSLV